LAPARFAPKNPDYEGWISLDSLVRIGFINGLRGINRQKFFSRSIGFGSVEAAAHNLRRREGWVVHGRKFNRLSDFLQSNVPSRYSSADSAESSTLLTPSGAEHLAVRSRKANRQVRPGEFARGQVLLRSIVIST
jgi:hypothetical protein